MSLMFLTPTPHENVIKLLVYFMIEKVYVHPQFTDQEIQA